MDSIPDGSGERSLPRPRHSHKHEHDRSMTGSVSDPIDPAIDIDAATSRAQSEPDAAAPTRPRGANWVAAYAVGLASAQRRDEMSWQELVEAADGDPARLDEARERLRQVGGFDDGLHQRAEELLVDSLKQMAVDE